MITPGSLLGGLVVTAGGDSAAMLTGAALAALTFMAFGVSPRPARPRVSGEPLDADMPLDHRDSQTAR